MTDRVPLTQLFLCESLDYCNGKLIWKERPVHHFVDEWRQKLSNRARAGKAAGTIVSGYVMINFKQGRIGAHRAIFLMHHGFLPAEIDHIDGDPLNNRLENLRAATHAQNLRNMKTPTSNTSGIKGVSFHKKTGKYRAYIRAGGKLIHLGVFESLDEAALARSSAEKQQYGEFSNDR